MKPEDYDPATLDRLEQHLRTLHTAIDKLNDLSRNSRNLLDRFTQLLKRAEQICQQPPLRGITIEDEAAPNDGEPEPLQPEEPEDTELEGDIDFGIGHFIEFASYEEFKKFQKMPPINQHDIDECDIDEMIRKLIAPVEGE